MSRRRPRQFHRLGGETAAESWGHVTRRTTRRRSGTAAAALLLAATALAGCSSDQPDDPRTTGATPPTTSGPYDRVLVRDGLADLYAGPGASREDRSVATCFADALLERLALADLEAAGLLAGGDVVGTSPVLDEPTAEAWVDAQLTCSDYVEVSTSAQLDATKGAVDAAGYEACLRDRLDDELLRTALVATLTAGWDRPEVTELARAQGDCATANLPTG